MFYVSDVKLFRLAQSAQDGVSLVEAVLSLAYAAHEKTFNSLRPSDAFMRQ